MYLKILLISLLALTFVGCDHHHENENQAESEEVKFQYTAYSDHFELFAEADPFVIGEMSNILSHFTNLAEFTALTKGSITVKIIVDGKAIEQTLESPTRKGIYSFDIKPEVSGDGTMEYLIKIDNDDFRVIVPDIRVYSNHQEAAEAAGESEISGTNTTVFTKEQSWKIDFSTGYPVRKTFGQVIKTIAQILPAQSDEALLTAKANGVISFSGNRILEGINVSAGQTLLTINGSGLAENNSAVRFAEAQNNFEKAKADFERVKLLAEDKIMSERQLLESKTLFENARSVYESLIQNFNAAGQTVISPVNGFVSQLYVKNGQYVEAGQPLIMLTQNKSLWLRAEVQQKNAKFLRLIESANIRTVEDNKIYTLDELNGKVISIGKTTTSDNFLIPVTLQIDKAGNFVPGSFVELYLKTISNTKALTVPNTSILEEMGNFFVFVQVTPELFEKREIKTGVTDGMYVEVLSGLADDERVVTKGAILIKLAQATGTLDAHSGHVH